MTRFGIVPSNPTGRHSVVTVRGALGSMGGGAGQKASGWRGQMEEE